MTFNSNKTAVTCSPQFYIVLAVSILLIPLRWLMGWMIATIVHEVGHFLALKACRCPVYRIQIGLTGVIMSTGPLSPAAELFCASSGPVLGATLLLGAKHFPVLAVCAFVQTLFNLAPIYPMDGGRILSSALLMLFSQNTAYQIQRIINIVIHIVLVIAFLWISVKLSMPVLPIIALCVIAAKHCYAKSTCKGGV